MVGVEVMEDDAGQAAFEACAALQGCEAPVSSRCAVVGLAESVEADLGDGDAVQGGVELPIAERVIRTRPAVLPDHTGIGATPA